MKKKRRVKQRDQGEMDMTPMIDIVFNLLIFFMVVTDLTQKDLALLTLPLAHMAEEDKDDDPDDRLIVNIDKFGQLMIKSRPYSLEELGTLLDNEKRLYERRKGKEAFKMFGDTKATELFVLLRADKDTPWQHVQWIMTIMAENQFYKLQFATKKFIGPGYTGDDGRIEAEMLGGITQEQFQRQQEGG